MTASPLRPLLILLACAAPAADLGAQEWMPPWQSLFDGKTLDGWKAGENPGSFRVEDGAIVAHGERAHLCYGGPIAGAMFRNFEFEAEVRTKPGSNGGIFFHTAPQQEGWLQTGLEAQVNNSGVDWIRTASLYGVENVARAAAKDDSWFRLGIVVRGRHVTTTVDGKTVVAWKQPDGWSDRRRIGRGTFALQAHDPRSEVRYRSLRVRILPVWSDDLSRSARYLLNPGKEWWDRMDVGPALACTLTIDGQDNLALKGLTVELAPDHSASMTFDTELLRMAAGWDGPIDRKGVTWDGSHGGNPKVKGPILFTTRQAPGVADASGSWKDPRPIPYGPLPKAWGRWKGHFRSGEKVVLAYSAGGVDVLERPAVETADGARWFTRTLETGPAACESALALADVRNAPVAVGPDGLFAEVLAASASDAPVEDTDRVQVVTDRTEGDWDELAMGPPSTSDAADAAVSPSVRTTWAAGFAAPHRRSGARDGALPRWTDGAAAGNQDQPGRVVFFDGGPARVQTDLGAVRKVRRVDTYSWHRTNRAPQRFKLWGAGGAGLPPDAGGDLAASGWTLLAAVDSGPLGDGGKHGSSVVNPRGVLGELRFLLWELAPSPSGEGTFVTEADVWTDERGPPKLRAARNAPAPALAVALLGAPAGMKLTSEPAPDPAFTRIALRIPAGTPAARFKVALTRDLDAARGDAQRKLAPAEDLGALTRGGPSLWPEKLPARFTAGAGKGPWVVDDVEVPFENPWGSEMRLGAFDWFEDGNRAALCTWNGDVWIVDGLGGGPGPVTWRRFAAGLFEPLGLCIVDGVIHVNGRDQVTRLHDLDGDGEADRYECFNNDVLITRNFHEFAFDLQTDAAGDFWFSKAGPVRPGGRGFDPIVPHHGTVLKLAKDGSKLEVFATGLRAPNGVGVGPHGEITAGDNQGSWVPRCKLHWMKPGSFQGVVPLAHRSEEPKDYEKPLCWFPMEVDNSGGSQVWVPDDRWGPFAGDLLHLSYGTSSIYKVLKDQVGGLVQGGVVRIPVALGSSAMRARFRKQDGQLWVSGLQGWQTNANRLAAFQRVRWTGKEPRLPKELKVRPGGLELTFTCALDPAVASDPGSWSIQQWNYVWGPQYGGPEVSADRPDPSVLERALKQEMHDYKKHDRVHVDSVDVRPDGRTVFLHIPSLRPVMQMWIRADLATAAGEDFAIDVWNTINFIPGGNTLFATKPNPATEGTRGLSLGIEAPDGQGYASRVVRLPALAVAPGESPAEGVPPGPFRATFTGDLDVERRADLRFSAEGKGRIRLSVREQIVLEGGSDDFSKLAGKPVRLARGPKSFRLEYESPSDGSAELRVFWESADFFREPIPPEALTTAVPPFVARYPDDLLARDGKHIVRTHRCAACHQVAHADPITSADAPTFDSVGGLLEPQWMAQWTLDPKSFRPQATMPALGGSDPKARAAEARDIAAWLATLGEGTTLAPEPSDPAAIAEGGALFAELGCVGCHLPPDRDGTDSGHDRIPLRHVGAKFRPGALRAFLLDPAKHFVRTGMPRFGFTETEAGAIAAFLRSLSPAPAAFPLDGADPARGAALAAERGCLNCHDVGCQGALVAPDLRKSESIGDRGCLAVDAGRRGPVAPDFGFRVPVAESIAAYLPETQSSGGRASLPEEADRSIHELRCTACHELDGSPDTWSQVAGEVSRWARPRAEGGVDQTRPSLTWIGDKLRPEWIRKTIEGSLAEPVRPWLKARMPAFPAYAEALARGLPAMHGHGVAPAPEAAAPDPDLAQAGGVLVSRQGFGCMACHALEGAAPYNVFEVQGPDLRWSAARLREPFFHRWIRNPRRTDRSSRMPTYAYEDGSTQISDVLDGDAARQFDAMWHYLRTLR